MDASVLAAAALQARNNIVKNQKDEVVTTSDKGGATRTSFQSAPTKSFSLPKTTTSTPKKPPDWKKPDKKYGGQVARAGSSGTNPSRPDLSKIGAAIVERVHNRKDRITTPGYNMKVRDSCPLPCCQYLHLNREEEKQPKLIIKKVIRRRRPKQGPPQLSAAPQQSNLQQQQQQQQQAARAEAARRQQQELQIRQRQQEAERQRQEAERKQQEEMLRQQQLEEQQRQHQLMAEAERQQQQAAAAAPVQRMAIFQNLGTDPAMAKAELYYESTRWGPVGHGDPPVEVGTFPGHRWFIVANGMYAKLFTIGEDAQQTYTF